MEKYENIKIEDVANLKRPTIYFFLKERKFSEHYIKNLRNESSAILLNGTPVNIRKEIKDGDILEIKKNPNAPSKIQFCDGKLDILFEDDDYLIVNKPHNLACIPTRSHYGMNLGGQVCKYMHDKDENFVLRIINRLDRETAGIVVIAKNPIACNSMTDLRKEYHAICYGNIEHDFTIDKPILTLTHDGINERKRIISPNGKRAVTHIEVLRHISNSDNKTTLVNNQTLSENQITSHCTTLAHDNNLKKDMTLVKLTLETGRTHQIRVHMADAGHPLVNDDLYGFSENLNKDTHQKFNDIPNKSTHAMLLLKNITFTHFRTGQVVALSIPYPASWKNFFEQEI